MRFLKNWKRRFVESPLGGEVGRMFLPRRRERVLEHFFTGRHGLVDACVRRELERRYYAGEEHIRDADLWSSTDAEKWHSGERRAGLCEHFQRTRGPLLEMFSRYVEDEAARGAPVQTVLEIGCGSGVMTVELSLRVGPDVPVVGLDMNEHTVRTNRECFCGASACFECGMVQDFLDARDLPPRTVFLSCCVMECIPQPETEALLVRMRRAAPEGALLLLEPSTRNFDPDPESKPRGSTFYAHNYPALCERAGYFWKPEYSLAEKRILCFTAGAVPG